MKKRLIIFLNVLLFLATVTKMKKYEGSLGFSLLESPVGFLMELDYSSLPRFGFDELEQFSA